MFGMGAMAENSDSLLDSTSPEYFVELNPVDGSVAGQEALHARPQEEILEDCGFRAIDLLEPVMGARLDLAGFEDIDIFSHA